MLPNIYSFATLTEEVSITLISAELRFSYLWLYCGNSHAGSTVPQGGNHITSLYMPTS